MDCDFVIKLCCNKKPTTACTWVFTNPAAAGQPPGPIYTAAFVATPAPTPSPKPRRSKSHDHTIFGLRTKVARLPSHRWQAASSILPASCIMTDIVSSVGVRQAQYGGWSTAVGAIPHAERVPRARPGEYGAPGPVEGQAHCDPHVHRVRRLLAMRAANGSLGGVEVVPGRQLPLRVCGRPKPWRRKPGQGNGEGDAATKMRQRVC